MGRVQRKLLYVTGVVVLLNVALFAAFLLRSPRRAAPGSATNEAAPGDGRAGVYAVTGIVLEVRDGGTNLRIRHDPVPGYMPAMTMPFLARDPRETASVQAGDQIAFRLLVTDEESWIDSVRRLGVAETPQFLETRSRIVRDVDPLELGQPMPDYVFTNQFGLPTRLGDFRGRALALTFIFTRCPLPDFCPRMLKNFAAVRAELESRAGAPTNWHLVTLTIDPLYDTVPVMKAYAERNHYDPARWTFLTGALIDIDAITEQVGLVFRRQTPDALPDHNVRTVVVDTEGRLRKIIVGNTWNPGEVVEDLVTWAKPPAP